MKKNLVIKNFIKKKFFNNKLNKNLFKNYVKAINEIKKEINSSQKTLNILNNNFRLNFSTQELKNFKKFNSITIVGMGGSILGAEAIYFFLKSKIKKKVYFFNDINEEKFLNLKKKRLLDKTLFLIISKSGNTIETLSNLLSLNIIKKNAKNIIIVSEKKNNVLYELSNKYNLFYVEHKNYIGGRYSVLSEVGLVPAFLMGLDIQKLRKNLKKYLNDKNKYFLKDSAIKISNMLLNSRFSNIIFLNYVPQLEKFLYWCQQLIAESLGKKGRGFLPVISSAPKDHHSLLQLYLDGPKNKIFYIFSNEKKYPIKIKSKKLTNQMRYIHNKNLSEIKIAQKNAFIQSVKKKNIPYREFKILNFNEDTLGELFSYFMLEVVLVGKITNVNPFDQPAVEDVKINTKKRLI